MPLHNKFGRSLVFAQATAVINGRVVDPADAVVPNATVTVTNLGMGVARDSATNAEGLYSVPTLTPGNYPVKVKAQGFETDFGRFANAVLIGNKTKDGRINAVDPGTGAFLGTLSEASGRPISID